MKTSLKYILIAFLMIFLSIQVKSQENWNLKKCVTHAIENNINLNINKNILLKQEINLYESKANLFPSLNIGSGLNINYGRNIDGSTNDITYSQTISNNLWLNSSVDLFQGLVKQNTISFNKYMLAANKQENEIIKNKLIFDLITAYYILMYSEGLTNVAKSQVDLSQQQYKRMQKLVDVGKESPITIQDLKSQWVADKLSLTKAENLSKEKILELKQLLRLNTDSEFAIDTSGINAMEMRVIPSLENVYNSALNIMPEIKQQEFLIQASKKNLAISKGKISPRLYMSAGLNSYYFDGSTVGYGSQLTDNQNQYINFGLVIPIFNNASIQSDIKRKRIDFDNQKLNSEKQKEQILTQVQKVHNNVKSAESEYNSSLELYKYSKLSFKNVSKKLEKGIASTSDFELAKQRLVTAKVAMLKAKLTYLMYYQILEYYETGNWDHVY
jgi:outer membrane protein